MYQRVFAPLHNQVFYSLDELNEAVKEKVKEHMPAQHKFYASWSVEKFESWAASIGDETLGVIRHLLESKHHPEQALKSCIGILSLASKCENNDLNMACRKAWNLNRISYREIKGYLKDLIRLKKT